MTIGGWIFFILTGGAITAIMVYCYIKVFKDDSDEKEIEQPQNQ